MEGQLETMASWKAAFIEDAEDLHLASKPMFLVAVHDWGTDARVASKFVRNTVGGGTRLNALLKRLELIRQQAEGAKGPILTAPSPESQDSLTLPGTH